MLAKLEKNEDIDAKHFLYFKNCKTNYWKQGKLMKKIKRKSHEFNFTGFIINGKPNGFCGLDKINGELKESYKGIFRDGYPVKAEY